MHHFDFAIIGAGPAAICAIPALIAKGIDPNKIIWIDANDFKVGAFGTSLSEGSSLPGNTSVESYTKVNQAIYKIFPDCKPDSPFLMDTLPLDTTCLLKIAAEPIQHISDYFKKNIQSIYGTVTSIDEDKSGFKIKIELSNHTCAKEISAKKCIIAIGADPKKIYFSDLYPNLTIIHDPNIVFIKSRLQEYIETHPGINQVVVIGSSHSAALATMNLLEANIKVKHFMNKPYKFAEPCVSPEGIKYTKHDNTGLKGEVALFTKKLLTQNSNYDLSIGSTQQEINKLIADYLSNLPDDTHLVSAVGYKTSQTLKVNNLSLEQLRFNHKTSEFYGIKNLFGLGIAFPLQTIAPDGEHEFSVGYGKFWNTVNKPEVVEAWGL